MFKKKRTLRDFDYIQQQTFINVYEVPATVLDAWDKTVNKTKIPVVVKFTFQQGEEANNTCDKESI